MRFSTSVFALFAASVIYANGIDNGMNLFSKYAVKVSIDGPKDVDVQCDKELTPYDECIDDPTPLTLDEYCPKFLSENCQKFYKDPMSFIPSCKESEIVANNFNEIVKSVVPVYNLACQKDESGNPCPFSEIVIKSFSFIKEDELNSKMDNTCRSDLCREATRNAFADDTEFSITLKKKKYEYLDSDKCKNMSGAVSLKIGSGILISIGLFLLSLY